MNMRRRLTAAVTTALIGFSMTACGSGGDDGVEEVTVAVLGPGSLQWLHAVAEDQGFYADHGVEVEELQVQDSGALVQAVASASADAGIALGDNVVRAVDEGADVRITGALIQKPALRLYGAPGYDDVGDLEGTEVTAGATEGGTYELLVYMLQEAGVDTEGLTPMAIANSSDRVVAIENDQVQGALLIPPFDSLAEDAGATMLDWHDEYWLQTPAVVNGAWADDNPEAAAGFTQGLADAARFFDDESNSDEVVRVLMEYADVEEDAAQDAYDFIAPNEIFSPDLSVRDEGLVEIAEIGAAVSGEELGDFDPADYVDDSYLDAD